MSILAVFLMVMTPILAKRYSAKSRYYAWLIIIIGLIIPFRPQLDHAIVTVDMSAVTVPIIPIDNVVPVPMSNEVVTAQPSLPNISWWQIVAAVWLVGMICFVVYHIIKHIRFVKMAKRWRYEVTDKEAIAIFENIKNEMAIFKQISFYFCPCVGSPTMIGFFTPYILLPDLNFSKKELYFILKHELVHYSHKDLYYKFLVLMATAIHWFNPIVYLLARAINILCEIFCDTEVVYHTDADTRQRYSETIINIVRYQAHMHTALSTNFYGGKKGMKERIFSIMDSSKKKTGMAIACVVILITIVMSTTFTATATPGNTLQEKGQSVYGHRVNSLIQNFKKYKSFGVIYNADQDAVYYKGKRVKLFVEFKVTKGKNMNYAFDLCYRDSQADSTLYLEAVKDKNGNVTGIKRLSDQIAFDLLDDMDQPASHDKPTKVSPPKDKTIMTLTMDATQIIEKYGIIATDKFNGGIPDNIKHWIKQCDKKQGAYILKSKVASGYITYIYYNGGDRYPWAIKADNKNINVRLYSDTKLTIADSHYLMYFKSPKDYTNINLYLDNLKLNYKLSRN